MDRQTHITREPLPKDQILHAPRGSNISRSALPGDATVFYKIFRKGLELRPEEMPAQVAVATGKPVMGEELEFLLSDGRKAHIILSAVPLFDAEGHVRGAVITGADVTQIKLAEEALLKVKDELELRVQERTSDIQNAKEELEVTNEELRIELEQHSKLEAELIKAKDVAEESVKAKAAVPGQYVPQAEEAHERSNRFLKPPPG
jgi:hypothetical protein